MTVESSSEISAMAELLAKQKLVPFFGAGISRQHLGVDGESLAREMCATLGLPADTLLADVSDLYVERFGPERFIAFLREKLVLSSVDDAKAETHILLASLGQNLLYTTNQDNIFELIAAKYGRRYRRVATLTDLSEAIPGEPLLIKFHGDTDEPETLVFGSRSYLERMATDDHPLDIKLRADLLGKRLLFLGYSLRDENVTKLIAMVRKTFRGKLPPSYLMAYEYDPSMDKLEADYGIQIVDPKRLFPDALTSSEAFLRYLKLLCDETVARQVKKGLDELISNQPLNPRVPTRFEVDAVGQVVAGGTFDDAVNAFRGTYDASLVPEHLQSTVLDQFKSLVDRADRRNPVEMGALKGILFQFRISAALALEAVAYLMAACNQRPTNDGFDDFITMICPAMPDGLAPVAAACAVEVLRDRGEAITDNFRRLAMTWFRGADEVPESMRDAVVQMIALVWPGEKNLPLFLRVPNFLKPKGFHALRGQVMSHFPKQLKRPKE